MPLVGFTSPKSSEIIGLKEAPAWFEEQGLLPLDVIQAMVDEAGRGDHSTALSPSIMEPANNCRREIVGKRFLPYTVDPVQLWAALKGTLFHRMMLQAGENETEWSREVRMGPEELWPGIVIGGTLDRTDAVSLIDYKTTKTPRKGQDHRELQAESARVQVNLYRMLYEAMSGVKIQHMWLWRMYWDHWDRAEVFAKIPVKWLDKDDMWQRIGVYAESLRDYLAQAGKIVEETEAGSEDANDKLKGLVQSIPMDGEDQQQFNGKKCTQYCVFFNECMRLAGRATF
jgi:RecB family exonuclease